MISKLRIIRLLHKHRTTAGPVSSKYSGTVIVITTPSESIKTRRSGVTIRKTALTPVATVAGSVKWLIGVNTTGVTRAVIFNYEELPTPLAVRPVITIAFPRHVSYIAIRSVARRIFVAVFTRFSRRIGTLCLGEITAQSRHDRTS